MAQPTRTPNRPVSLRPDYRKRMHGLARGWRVAIDRVFPVKTEQLCTCPCYMCEEESNG